MNRRGALSILGATAATFAGLRFGFIRAARPAEAEGPISKEARTLIDRAWTGIDPARVLDAHVHIVGLGVGGTGCWVNPRSTQWLRHPIQYGKFSIYRRAAGITDDARADDEYVDKLAALVRTQRRHGRLLILAFDQVHAPDGTPRPDHSEFFTPNDYVLKLARENPDVFVPCASIHPYRKDAVDALHQAVDGGAIAVKWLPNAQVIDPASPRCDAFYDALAELNVPLIAHAGEEQAVEAQEDQELGNPLRFRRPLDRGVKVILAHCASLGEGEDLDAPSKPPPLVSNFDLFLRLMDQPEYEGRLFADISALPQSNRAGRPLAEMLARTDLHHRLIYGSDYPLPAINALTRTGVLVGLGYLTDEERTHLNELDRHNPLLFDFVLKRTLRGITKTQEKVGFADEVFMPTQEVFPRLA